MRLPAMTDSCLLIDTQTLYDSIGNLQSSSFRNRGSISLDKEPNRSFIRHSNNLLDACSGDENILSRTSSNFLKLIPYFHSLTEPAADLLRERGFCRGKRINGSSEIHIGHILSPPAPTCLQENGSSLKCCN